MNDIAPLFVIVYLDEGCPHAPGKILRDQVRPRWCSLCDRHLPQRRLGTVLITVSEAGELTAEAYAAGHPGETDEQ